MNATWHPFDPYAEISLSPLYLTEQDMLIEGPQEGQKNFLCAVRLHADTVAVIEDMLERALEYAQSVRHAVMHFQTDGWVSVFPVTAPLELSELQYLVNGYIEGLETPRLGNPFDSPYIGYANEDGLGVYPLNVVMGHFIGHEGFCGPGVLEVGMHISPDTGDTVLWADPTWPSEHPAPERPA